MALPEELIKDVRNHLDITWDDEAGDKKLSGIIARGISYIDDVAGCELNYTDENKPRELLMEYCRYVRSDALDKFQINYMHELLRLQMEYEIKAHMEKTTLSALTIGELTLSPVFTPTEKLYTTQTVNDSDIITAAAADPTVLITITNGDVLVENRSAAIWAPGNNVVKIVVEYAEITAVYTVVVLR